MTFPNIWTLQEFQRTVSFA